MDFWLLKSSQILSKSAKFQLISRPEKAISGTTFQLKRKESHKFFNQRIKDNTKWTNKPTSEQSEQSEQTNQQVKQTNKKGKKINFSK